MGDYITAKEDKSVIEGWLSDSEYLLTQAEEAEKKGVYHYVVFNLQQAEEKIAKSTLACNSLTNMSEPDLMSEVLGNMLGLKDMGPEDYGHNWHRSLLNQLNAFYTSPVLKSISPDLPVNLYQDMGNKISNARQIKSNPNPQLAEVRDIIKACNTLLDLTSDNGSMLQVLNGVSNLRLDLDRLTENVSMVSSMDNDASYQFIVKRLKMSIAVITLAILDVYLEPHSDARYYPRTKSKVTLDRNFPIVTERAAITALLNRCIDLDRRHLTNTL